MITRFITLALLTIATLVFVGCAAETTTTTTTTSTREQSSMYAR